MNREPSFAETQGWRRFFDGWVICPPCQRKQVGEDREWPVAATYDKAIAQNDKCCRCGSLAPLELTEADILPAGALIWPIP